MSRHKINIPVVIVGVSLLVAGVNTIVRGNIWDLVLGDERYFVGGIALAVGLFFTGVGFNVMRIFKKDKP